MKEYRIIFMNGDVLFVKAADMTLCDKMGEYHFFDQVTYSKRKIIARCPKENVCLIKEETE